jgi:hypothetical protein
MSTIMGQFLKNPSPFSRYNRAMNLWDFLDALERDDTFFRLGRAREQSVMVEVALPGVRYEVEFLSDGTVEMETFRSEGIQEISAEAVLQHIREASMEIDSDN